MSFHNQHILVTGGAGFIGSHLVEELVHLDARVTVADRFAPSRPNALQAIDSAIRTVNLDVGDKTFGEYLKHEAFDAILHLAGPASVPQSVEDPYQNFEDSLHNTIRLLEILREHNTGTKLILASSASVYGNPISLPMTESDPTHPISPYGVAKLAIERYGSVYSQLYGLSVASLRFFSLYGPRQRKMLVYDQIVKLAQNPTDHVMWGTSEISRDFIYIKDAVQAVLTILKSGTLKGEVYNVASGQPHTTHEVAQTIADALQVNPRITFTGEGRAGDPDKWWADIDKIRALGFKPQTSLAKGIEETVAWYHQESGTTEL